MNLPLITVVSSTGGPLFESFDWLDVGYFLAAMDVLTARVQHVGFNYHVLIA